MFVYSKPLLLVMPAIICHCFIYCFSGTTVCSRKQETIPLGPNANCLNLPKLATGISDRQY